MKKEWKIFLTAIMYFTRIKVPQSVRHDPGSLQQAPRYFPAVGWVVAAISSMVFLVTERFVSTDAGILFSMIAGLLTTGAFHEDGFADVCDGFGGGWTKEAILRIMKDSRIGAFGAIGLLAILGSKFVLLRELPSFTPSLEHPTSLIFYNYRYFILILFAAHSLSRLMPVFIIQWGQNVTDEEHSKSKPVTSRRLSVGQLGAAIIMGILPLVLLPPYFFLVILPAGYVTWEMMKYFKRWIGGYTGDCLGAAQQVTELVIYLSAIIIWRYLP